MSTPDDGGPAFPNNDANGCAFPGMTLHDYFAGQALVGISTPGSDDMDPEKWNWNIIAKIAWSAADAMMAEKERRAREG